MSHPINESLIFMSIARSTIAEAIESSNSKSGDMVNFITNEASDYQVMSFLVDGVCPDEKFNSVAESDIWNRFSKSVMYDFRELSESIDHEALESIVYEMGPVSDLGYSSAAPIMEFQMNQGMLDSNVLNEIDFSGDAIRNSIGSAATAAKNKLAVFGGKMSGAANIAKPGIKGLAQATKSKIKGLAQATKSGVKGVVQGTKVGYKVGGSGAKASIQAAKVKGLKVAALKKKLALVAGKKATGGYQIAIKTAKMNAISTKLAAAKALKISAASSVKGLAITGAKVAGGALVVAALVAYGAYKIYKRFMSQAARACGGKASSGEKTACMKQYRVKAMKGQIAALSSGSSKCKTSKDPAKCQATVKAKIAKLKNKISKISR